MNFISKVYTYCKENIYVIGILVLAACLRFPGFLHGLPTYPDADEPVAIHLAVDVLKGQINPHWFLHPSLNIYVNAFIIRCVQIVYHGLHLLGLVSHNHTPYWLFFAAGRFFNILLSLSCVMLVYYMTKLITTKKTGVFAALIMAILPLHTLHIIRVVPNTIALTMVTGGIFFSLKYLKEKKVTWLYTAAVFSGLAIGAKYMFVAPLSFLLAKWFKNRREGNAFFDTPLFVSIGIVIITFTITTPFAILSFREFLALGPLKESAIYKSGPSDIPLFTYLTLLLKGHNGATPLVVIASISGIILHIKKHIRESLIVLIVPVAWLGICSFYKLVFLRQIIYLSIPIALFCGIALAAIPRLWLQITVAGVLSIHPIINNLKHIQSMIKPDIRYVAQQWINENIPPGSFVAREEYTPYYDEKKFKSVYLGITGLAFITPDSVYSLGCDYIVSAGYGRFRNDQERYSVNLMTIAQHEKKYDLIKTFNPGKHYRGHTLKIYKVK